MIVRVTKKVQPRCFTIDILKSLNKGIKCNMKYDIYYFMQFNKYMNEDKSQSWE